LFPDQASTMARRVDGLFFFTCAVTGTVGVFVTLLIIVFAVKYRRGSGAERTPRILGSLRLELTWTLIPFGIFMVMFVWGASVYTAASRPPDDAIEVYVVGKQWMWKLQHTGGQREINALTVPVSKAVKLTLISEDVIHDFAVPAFRLKIDVLPGRYVSTWFEATKVGEFHIFCDQYCGTNHSGMVGKVVVMKQEDYDSWLNKRAEGSLGLEGRKLFLKHECISCHSADSQAKAPVLEGLYGRRVALNNGRTVVADEGYIRESILAPKAKIVQGWEPIMPTFKGQLADERAKLSEEDALIRLVAYIKSLRPGETPVRTEEFPAPVQESAATKDGSGGKKQ
ncbi:MAG TPA: cytochrome c oxidase subunit II, partial [Gemmataceae bacterium]|nr:cytochrome c oxidase subunit II [Gemmataceae bacterium]